MKIIIIFLLLFSPSLYAKKDYTLEKFSLDDRSSTKVYLPKDLDSFKELPLIISLHGLLSTPVFQNVYFKAKRFVAKKGFILAVPGGKRNYFGVRFWNATDYCCDFFNQNNNDLNFLENLITSLKKKYPIDSKRVFLVGHSNGGFLAHAYACKGGKGISGIVSISGAGVLDPINCHAEKALSILQVHGTKDGIVKFNGKKNKYPSAFDSIAPWFALNNCKKDFDGAYKKIKSRGMTDCQDGKSVMLWAVQGGGHVIPLPERVSEKIIDYLFSEKHL